MKVGTRSLVFGVHQVFLHPIFVTVAWFKLYGCPSWKEFVCIVVHDWGYWGKPNMDGKEGESHPEFGARLAHRLLDRTVFVALLYDVDVEWQKETTYHDLCLYHSRHYAKNAGAEPSKLCWADKLSIAYEPWWLYLPRAWVSGELKEYRATATEFVPAAATHRRWFKWVKGVMLKVAEEQRGDAAPYVNLSAKEKQQ